MNRESQARHSPSNDAMRLLEQEVVYAAHSDARVLVSGDSASTKRFVAHLIHQRSRRRHGPFTLASCAEVLQQPSLLEASAGGSLFVHDVEQMTAQAQTRFLRLIETVADYNVRLMAGTSTDVYDRVQADKFSSDLFYRLNTIHLVLPSSIPSSFAPREESTHESDGGDASVA